MTYRRLFHEAGLQPLSDAVQVQVDPDQAQLPSPLDQLVRLHHQPLKEEDQDKSVVIHIAQSHKSRITVCAAYDTNI